jgi:hypothetical protein
LEVIHGAGWNVQQCEVELGGESFHQLGSMCRMHIADQEQIWAAGIWLNLF